MNYRAYEDFELLFECVLVNASKVYYAKLVKSPAGTTIISYAISQQWDLWGMPISWNDFSRAASTHDVFEAFLPQVTVHQWGKFLFESLFRNDLYRRLMDSLEITRLNRSGLRIILRFSHQTSELAILPWEYLYAPYPYEFFSLSPNTPIVRHLDLPDSVNVTPIVEILRILVVISAPMDSPDLLNAKEEVEALHDALSDSQVHVRVDVEILEKGTLESLHHRLLRIDKPIHILHFIGHGKYDSEYGEGVLLFETVNRQPDRVTADRLTVLLKDHSSLRLVFLNSCEGATSRNDEIFSVWPSSLLEARIVL